MRRACGLGRRFCWRSGGLTDGAGRILAPRGAKSSISRIDKDLKAELRETAFNMWMACYSQQEIAEAVGYSREAVKEFVNFLQDGRNGTDSENANSSENPQLASEADAREFDEDEEADSNGLGVYKLDKRLLIKANHMDEHYQPPIYNVWKQQAEGMEHPERCETDG